MMNEPISSIMTPNPLTVSINDKLSAVREILSNHRFHHVPVVDGKKLVGIISSYDIFTKLGKSMEDFNNLSVRDIMTTKIATLRPTEKIGAAAQIFLRHLFHGLPIVNDDMELMGIVTTHDLLRYNYDKEYPNDDFEAEWRNIEHDRDA
jgi:CBS domain-containing protein